MMQPTCHKIELTTHLNPGVIHMTIVILLTGQDSHQSQLVSRYLQSSLIGIPFQSKVYKHLN
jgi:hypothetical protein